MRTDWTLQKTWNESLDQQPKREVSVRDYMWASELGRADVDIYLKMLGTEPTNPPNSRAMRKFEAGNIWEWIVELILRRSGLYKASQEYYKTRLASDLLEVSGKLDFVAGGTVDERVVGEALAELHLPLMFERAIQNTMSYFKERYPEGLADKILEVKSVSSFAFDKIERTGKPVSGHDLQLFHYIQAKKMDGAIVYICRDDARMIEIFVSKDDEALKKRYADKVLRMTNFYYTKTQPPVEHCILFDEDERKFTKNFNVEYSPFITMLYKFTDQADYDEKMSPIIARWNRVIGKIRDGKEITEDNEEAMAEMEEAGFDIAFIKDRVTTKK